MIICFVSLTRGEGSNKGCGGFCLLRRARSGRLLTLSFGKAGRGTTNISLCLSSFLSGGKVRRDHTGEVTITIRRVTTDYTREVRNGGGFTSVSVEVFTSGGRAVVSIHSGNSRFSPLGSSGRFRVDPLAIMGTVSSGIRCSETLNFGHAVVGLWRARLGVVDGLVGLLSACGNRGQRLCPLAPDRVNICLSYVRGPGNAVCGVPYACIFSGNDLSASELVGTMEGAISGRPIVGVFVSGSAKDPVVGLHSDISFSVPIMRISGLRRTNGSFIGPFSLRGNVLFEFTVFRYNSGSVFTVSFRRVVSSNASISIVYGSVTLTCSKGRLRPRGFSRLSLSIFRRGLRRARRCRGSGGCCSDVFSTIRSGSRVARSFTRSSRIRSGPGNSFRLSAGKGFSIRSIHGFTLTGRVAPCAIFLNTCRCTITGFAGRDRAAIYAIARKEFSGRLGGAINVVIHALPVRTGVSRRSAISSCLGGVHEGVGRAITGS